jgi:type I restriction enzyme M protein
MLLHGLKPSDFNIYHGDSLTNEWEILNEQNPSKQMKFDAIVANPPFSLKWEPTADIAQDMRFKNYGVAPKSAADYAFLLHGFHFLKNDGTMAIILPHGVLFRSGAEAKIRQKLLKDNNIDAVIGLPSNLFFSTGIPVCILVLKKCKKFDDVLFINASQYYTKGKKQNKLLEEHVAKIVDAYKFRKEIDKYSRRVAMDVIAENEYNLNISRYISTAEPEVPEDLQAIKLELGQINNKILTTEEIHRNYLKELGLNL